MEEDIQSCVENISWRLNKNYVTVEGTLPRIPLRFSFSLETHFSHHSCHSLKQFWIFSFVSVFSCPVLAALTSWIHSRDLPFIVIFTLEKNLEFYSARIWEWDAWGHTIFYEPTIPFNYSLQQIHHVFDQDTHEWLYPVMLQKMAGMMRKVCLKQVSGVLKRIKFKVSFILLILFKHYCLFILHLLKTR